MSIAEELLVQFQLRTSAVVWAALVALAGLVLVAGAPQLQAENTSSSQNEPLAPSDARWTKVSVQLPSSPTLFPAGKGADIANSQCVICHSPDMVLYQPARTQDQWKETINKMRSVYGAPLPAEQVDVLATYLSRLKP
jgi:mono/diheme cytochrome c family protein